MNAPVPPEPDAVAVPLHAPLHVTGVDPVIDPTTKKAKQIEFGATVLVEDDDGNKKTYIIVGGDESEPEKGKRQCQVGRVAQPNQTLINQHWRCRHPTESGKIGRQDDRATHVRIDASAGAIRSLFPHKIT